jgi:anti-sigma factor RsiW
MLRCEEARRLLTPYVDDEVAAAERQALEQHLGACPPCSSRAAAERTARRVMLLRGRTLSPRAPDALRRRCASLAPGPRRASAWPGWRRLSLASGSLAVVVLAAVIGIGVATASPSLLAAELTLDHLKCFALFEPRDAAPDPGVVASRLAAAYGWRLAIPGSLAREQLTLMGARRCFSTDGTVAHVLYRHAGRPLSFFVMPGRAREAARVAMAGHVARIWSRGETTYVLLGSTSDPGLDSVAAYFQGLGPAM